MTLPIFVRRAALSAGLALPLLAFASASVRPEYGEVDSSLQVTLITSLHTSGPDVTDEEGMPKGWPGASDPRSIPLFVSGDNGDFLYVGIDRGYNDNLGGVLRVAPVPSQYQTDIPYPLFSSGLNADPDRHRSDTIGNLVQRANGDLVGALYELLSSSTSLGGGALYRMDFDGTHGALIESTVGQVIHPLGPLVADGDVVYGVDLGPEGRGRIFRLDADDTLEILHVFDLAPNGQPQMPNGFTLGSDGAIYGVSGYDRGLSFTEGTPTAPETPTGAIYRLNPDEPGSFTILRTLTLAEGEIVTTDFGATPAGLSRSPNALNWLVQDGEGWLYGTVAIGQCGIPSTNSTLRRHHPLCGMKKDSDHWNAVAFPYYDVPETVYGAVYRLRSDGSSFQVLHRFSYDDGASPRGPLAVGEDGAIYGTTLSGGLHESVHNPLVDVTGEWTRGRWVAEGNNPWPDNCSLTNGVCRTQWYSRDGVLYRIVPSQIAVDALGVVSNGGFELIHHFRYAESGKTPLGVTRGSDGKLYGTTAYGGGAWINARGTEYLSDSKGTLFSLGAASTAVVTLTVSPAEALPGDTVELTWTSDQATDCVASSSAGDWTGAQATQGSVDLVHSTTGSYTYGLICIDTVTGASVASGVQTLRIGRAATETDGNTVRYGNGGALSLLFLLALGGLAAFRAVASVRS